MLTVLVGAAFKIVTPDGRLPGTSILAAPVDPPATPTAPAEAPATPVEEVAGCKMAAAV